jgi:hypothetical protein
LIDAGAQSELRYRLWVWETRGLLWVWDGAAVHALSAALGDPAWRVRAGSGRYTRQALTEA